MSEEAEKLRAAVDHDQCVGVAVCLQLAPGAFRLEPSGQSRFVETWDGDPELLQEAADGCPMSAIRLFKQAARGESR